MATEDIVRKLVDAWNRHEVDTMIALYSQDAVVYGTLNPEGIKGKESLRKSRERLFNAFPDFKMKVLNIVAKDDIAWFEWVFTGTHTGPIQSQAVSIPPTNRVVEWRGADFVRFSQGLVVEERAFADLAAFMRQLGLKPGS